MVRFNYKDGVIGNVARFLAVLAVVTWTFGSLACPAVAGTGTEHIHVSVQFDDHGASDNHHESDVCCHELTTFSGVIASATLSPSVKVVVLPFAAHMIVSLAFDTAQPFVFLAAPTSTGPPRSRRLRFTTYSPLAPPFSRT